MRVVKQPVRATEKQAAAFRIVIGLGLLFSLAANLPGHMSVDSVIALTQARTGVRATWAPAVFSWLLKLFDELLAGTGLYVTATASLLFFSLISLPGLRGRASWAAVVLAAGAIFTPQLLIYQGIVWRDVVFANLSVAGFIFLAHGLQGWGKRAPWLALGAALICLVLASLVRQNGLLLALAAIGVLAWTLKGRGRRVVAAWSLGAVAVAAVLAFGINTVAQPAKEGPKLRAGAEALILQHYDIVGAKAHHPKLRFSEIGEHDPAAQAYFEAEAARHYSSARIDTLDTDPVFRKALWKIPNDVMQEQWRAVVIHYPAEGRGAHRLCQALLPDADPVPPDLRRAGLGGGPVAVAPA